MVGTGVCREEPGMPEREEAEASPGRVDSEVPVGASILTSGEGGDLWWKEASWLYKVM